MNLSKVIKTLESSFDTKEIVDELKNGFWDALENEENEDIKKELFKILEGEDFLLEFSGVAIYLLNGNSRKPFIRARLNISKKEVKVAIAWYEIEYGLNWEVLDDYFDLY